MASTSNHGTICWLEIPVLSASRAAVFYATVFGWDCSVPSSNSHHNEEAPTPSSSSSSSSSSSLSPSLHTWPSSSMNGGNGAPAATIHTFHKRYSGNDGGNASSSSSSSSSSSLSSSLLSGAFIQVPEGCLIRACEAETGEMAVLTTFAVESIDETLRKVVEMGGRMHSPRTLIGRNMGYFARFIDCEGNLHGIWASH